MPSISDVFGDALQPDLAIALQPVQLPIRKRSGPLPRLQFVIEFVGQRSVSAASAAALLSTQWHGALGDPESFAMTSADLEWQPLTASTAGSYDSLAIAWDLVSDKGTLSEQSANHLLTIADTFATQIQRKAMPMPVPADIGKAVSQVQQVAQNFDAGVSLFVLANSQEVSEFELWVWCAKLGLTTNLAEGTFDWISPASTLPLFSVSPVGETESFSLEGAQRGDKHEGVLLGFSVPRSPEPVGGFEGMLKAADFLATKMWGKVFDENDQPINDAGRSLMRSQLADAVAALQKFGFAPGSPEALALFKGA